MEEETLNWQQSGTSKSGSTKFRPSEAGLGSGLRSDRTVSSSGTTFGLSHTHLESLFPCLKSGGPLEAFVPPNLPHQILKVC